VGDLERRLEFLVKPPCLLYEDNHLLVANKPAGLNTHSPSPFAGEGLYDWLRHREPRWASLAIVHRLDKETSGIIVFSKSSVANRSLTDQFTRRLVRKKYLLLTDRPGPKTETLVRTALVRAGDKYVSRPIAAGSEIAETQFTVGKRTDAQGLGVTLIEAQPFTGRTHQIRVHAANQGFPILGDIRYGGTPAPRLCLHAAEITIRHPVLGQELTFRSAAEFAAEPGLALRSALLSPHSTTAYRLIHGATEGWPGWHVDRLGDYLLSQSAEPLTSERCAHLARLVETLSVRGAYHKRLSPTPARATPAQACPQPAMGVPAPDSIYLLENGLQFELSFAEGYSVGLFLDQRDNRRRLLTGHIAAGFPLFESPPDRRKAEILNGFSYTCGFSLYAAKAGARTTSLDLSKKYLEWGKRNFRINQIDPAEHDFIFGDVFDWLRRLHRKNRLFDVILLDPPTFSRSKEFGSFRAEKDYAKLISAALPLLKPRGVLFASSNAAAWPPEAFLASVRQSIQAAKRTILQEQYFPQPPDFPISRAEPAYLKTVWLRVG
jgi:23S rRNA (cytosine1962-C5)-methyltransferase